MTKAIPDAVLEQHLAILGKTGRGKTITAKDCVEQVYDDDFRVCILDTIKSDWWGLTSSADGRRPGLPFYILGGPHAHLPLSSNSGKAIADLVARGQLRHTILDMANFEPGGQQRFFVDFAPRLLQRIKGVLYLVIEEAHILAPKERSGMGYENMSIHWAKMLAQAGRSKGIRLIVISQRTQALHNAVLGSCDSMIVHGMTAPADMEPVVKWLKSNSKDKALNAEIAQSLSGLNKGVGWLCSGEAGIFEEVKFPLARTYDNTRTPENDEELGDVKTAPVDIDALRAILGKAAEEADKDDPAALRKRIADLEAQLAKNPSPKAIEEAFERGRFTAADQVIKSVAAERRNIKEKLSSVLGSIDSLRADIGNYMHAYSAAPAGNGGSNTLVPFAEMTARLAQKPVDYLVEITGKGGKPVKPPLNWTTTKDDEEGVTVRQNPAGLRLRILGALRWLEVCGMAPASRAALGAVADFTPNKGYGARTLGEMKTEGLITIPKPGFIELTSEGQALAPAPPQFRSLREAWQNRVGGLHRDILDVLYRNHPTEVTRQELGQVMKKQFERGYGARVLGELKTMGAIEYPTPGTLRLTKHVMPE